MTHPRPQTGRIRHRKIRITVEFETASAASLGTLTDIAINELTSASARLCANSYESGFRTHRIVTANIEEGK